MTTYYYLAILCAVYFAGMYARELLDNAKRASTQPGAVDFP